MHQSLIGIYYYVRNIESGLISIFICVFCFVTKNTPPSQKSADLSALIFIKHLISVNLYIYDDKKKEDICIERLFPLKVAGMEEGYSMVTGIRIFGD